MPWEHSGSDWEPDLPPSLPPEPEFHGGGMNTEPGPDPFGFQVWMDWLLKGQRPWHEVIAKTPLHLLGYVGF